MPQCISYVLLSMVFLLLGNDFKERVCGLIADSMFNLIYFGDCSIAGLCLYFLYRIFLKKNTLHNLIKALSRQSYSKQKDSFF